MAQMEKHNLRSELIHAEKGSWDSWLKLGMT